MNAEVKTWVEEQIELLSPKSVLWIDGSEEQLEPLRREACSTGELTRLNQEKAPGCYLYRTAPNDVARVESRTFICSKKEEDAGPANHWMEPEKAYALLRQIARNSYRDRTMYVIPFSMGPIGSPYARYGVEITDSIYVVLSMAIMTRTGTAVLNALDTLESPAPRGAWVRCLHCKCQVDPELRYICHFPEDNTIISVNSAYGGNVLLGKKCFALRIASHMARQEGWLAEHMLILGMENPQGKTSYVAAAFPSACGKTNFAMMIPPEGYLKKGYRIWCVGDDIAWLHIGPDGRLWAINPENGFFGVAPGTNEKSNPNALAAARTGTIFTNVALDLSDNTPWWEGLTKTPPEKALDWLGQPWDGTPGESGTAGTRGAHPNSRFTSPAINCPCLSDQFDAGQGVPISAILFGGRRAKMTPLVFQSFSWEHGVFLGSTMASETTAAAAGAVGVVRRDPMAMLPFCGYHMGDYFAHWLEMGAALGDKAPKIFHVNWFRTDEHGHFLWPGFGENLRVLEWILGRCDGSAHGTATPIGYLPETADLNLEGLNVPQAQVKELLSVDPQAWLLEAEEIRGFYQQFGDRLPRELLSQLKQLEARLREEIISCVSLLINGYST